MIHQLNKLPNGGLLYNKRKDNSSFGDSRQRREKNIIYGEERELEEK